MGVTMCLNFTFESTDTRGDKNTVEFQWLEHLWDYENLFETGVVRAIEDLL